MPRPATSDPLARYTAKRNFEVTPEPSAVRGGDAREQLSFVIQKHWASRLHYDFRLEHDGVLLSWAVPKGPSFDPKDKRMAVHVEDHPVSYGGFEGTIPPKQYGAGTVIVWDRGTWEPVGDAREGMASGKLVFRLHGEKLAGLWELVRIAKPSDKQDPWLLFKKRDEWAQPAGDYDVIAALPDSVIAKPLGLLEERDARGRATPAADGASAAPSSAADVPGAVKAASLPAKLAPQLASLARGIPSANAWSYELKFDGYRLLARIDAKGDAKLFTRNGHDWSAKMKPLVEALQALQLRSSWLDGEIVVMNGDGRPDFVALQNALDKPSRSNLITYYLFDAPFLDGHDLRRAPLHARRALLKALMEAKAAEPLRFSADFAADPASLLESACRMKLEGIIGKRLDAPYESERTQTWIKLKCHERQEFVIAGFSDRTGSKVEIGNLILAYHDEHGVLKHAGNVGTGWSSADAVELRRKLAAIETRESPFAPGEVQPGRWSRRASGGEHWVEPTLVAAVRFADWTPENRIRHATFEGLRDDKSAREITREAVVGGLLAAPAAAKKASNLMKVSNPERVIDPSTGLTKLALVRYYESVAEFMLPHLLRRPASLVRAPGGITGQIFFQKHDDKLSIPGLKELDPKLWPDHAGLLEVPTARALASAAQMNTVEFHTWNSTTRSIDKPDRMVFDLDPGEGVGWPRVQEAAMLMRTLLDELKLKSWLKTSGGKGLHVVVPLKPALDYDTVKAFSQAIVQHLAQTIPARFVAKSGASNRVGRIFVDYLRNGHGATTVAAFSARARPGLGVSIPIAWDQLASLKSGAQWTIATAREHLSFQTSDPWADYWTTKQTLGQAMKALGCNAKGAKPAAR